MEYSVYGDTKKIVQYHDINLDLCARVSLIRFHCGLINIILGSKMGKGEEDIIFLVPLLGRLVILRGSVGY